MPRPSAFSRARTARWQVWAAIAGGVLLVAVIALALMRWTTDAAEPAPQPPAPGTAFLVPEDSHAAEAAGSGGDRAARAAAQLAATPTAVWLVPERDPLDAVGARVAEILAQARDQEATPVVVLYGLPDRDCGDFSAGGLDAADYPEWIAAIAEPIHAEPDVPVVVILEPDSIAQVCADADERAALLADAASALDADHVWTYLDGGHSRWVPADEMAQRIAAVATLAPGAVRGFATNVSNAQADVDEVSYAHRLSRQITAETGTLLHAVIDTSRNGAGAPADGQWCNVPGLRIGEQPGAYGDTVVDTNLWIKPPGESDGTCNGGPPAGEWWPRAALELTRDARG